MFLGVNMFLTLLGAHFTLACGSGLNEPESGQKHIYAREQQLYCCITPPKIEKGKLVEETFRRKQSYTMCVLLLHSVRKTPILTK